MRDRKARTRSPNGQKVPRIGARAAAKLFERCETLLAESGDLLTDYRSLLKALDEEILRLAIQPDSWGERTRACLISAILSGLSEDPYGQKGSGLAEIVHISNILMPCFLLELGRRRQHIQIEFPPDPCEPRSQFRLGLGSSEPAHSLTAEQLLRLVTLAGEDLVGLCYFGDQKSRARLAVELAPTA